MSQKVWFTNIMKDYNIGYEIGVTQKYFDEEWHPSQHEQMTPTKERVADIRRYASGYSLDRRAFPEFAAVFDEKCFRKTREAFPIDGFLTIRKPFADILIKYDLGHGELIPVDVFRKDLTAKIDEDFFFLNFGCRKDSFVSKESQNVKQVTVNKDTGREIWKIHNWAKDRDVILSKNSLIGPDLWIEEKIPHTIFMSDRLVSEILWRKLKMKFSFTQCEVLED